MYNQPEGLELRKAALMAAGWTVKQDGTWNGQYIYALYHDGKFYRLPDHVDAHTPEAAWQAAPEVESSVDAALEWLVLGRYHGWQLLPVTPPPHLVGGDYSSAIIVNWLSGDEVAVGNHPSSLAVAMCQSYLQFKSQE